MAMRWLSDVLRHESIERVISVILRLPGLFLLEYYYHQTYSKSSHDTKFSENGDFASLLRYFMPFQAMLFLLLPLQHLVAMYMHYLSAALLGYAELYSQYYISHEHIKEVNLTKPLFEISSKLNIMHTYSYWNRHHIEALCLHIAIATAISLLLDVKGFIKRTVLCIYALPVIAHLARFPHIYLSILHKCASLLTALTVLIYCLTLLPQVLSYMKHVYQLAMHFQHRIDVHHILSDKFCVMPQLFVFWCSLLAAQLFKYLYPQLPHPGETVLYPSDGSEWYLVLLYAVSEICSSPISLVASCAAVMYISWAVLCLTTVLARGPMMEQGLGTGEGVTMALLALQTGLVDLPMPQRMGAMAVILFIVLASLVQSMYERVEPLLLGLCAAHTHSPLRHARVLLLCVFLLVFPLYMTVFLCQLFDIDFWTLVVVSTCALTSVQVLGALTVYGLFMYDALQKDSGWEELDDVVYYARAVIRVLEFIVAVLVVGAGVRESISLSSEGRPWSWLNGSVLVIHFYYNVYLRLQSGWDSFLLRREAARKIHSLPDASMEQLQARAHDVCAICYAEMARACVTPCTHLFHAACLKKWLYVQDRCPLCSAQIVFGTNLIEHETQADESPVTPEHPSNDTDADDRSSGNCNSSSNITNSENSVSC